MACTTGAWALFFAFVLVLAPDVHASYVDTIDCDGNSCMASAPKVGVIGAGIGGASSAYFLHLGLPLADIHVFEKDHAVGGRVRSMEIEGARVEVGASIYHISNRYFDNFVRELGLKLKEPPNLGLWGIWNGKEFAIQESEWLPLSLIKMLYRYGLSPFKVENLATHVKEHWVEVYSKLENSSYETSEALLDALGVSHYTQESLRKALQDGGVGEEYTNELVTAIERVNYGQSTEMNAFAGFVGLVGSGKGTLFSVEGGNHLVVERLLAKAQAKLHLGVDVSSVSSVDGDTRYRVKYRGSDGQEQEDIFDAVIVATPLEFTRISFKLGDEEVPEGELPQAAGKRRAYQTTHATLVVATEMKRSFFGISDDERVPSFVLTTENPNIPFNSASVIKKLNATHNIYKVFSRKEMTDDTLDRLFAGRAYTSRTPWAAYPVLTPYPFAQWPRIKLHDKLYYANAFESAVSCMETQIASARNIANLILRDLSDCSELGPELHSILPL